MSVQTLKTRARGRDTSGCSSCTWMHVQCAHFHDTTRALRALEKQSGALVCWVNTEYLPEYVENIDCDANQPAMLIQCQCCHFRVQHYSSCESLEGAWLNSSILCPLPSQQRTTPRPPMHSSQHQHRHRWVTAHVLWLLLKVHHHLELSRVDSSCSKWQGVV